MALRRRMMAAMCMVIMLCMLCVTGVLAEEKQEITVLFTHDMHSHLDAYKIKREGEDTVLAGGLAKLKTMVDKKREEQTASILVDGGDFAMGTLYQTIYETEAPELTVMGYIGYDATTFGNHEFDYRSEGVSNMFHAALDNAAADPSLTLPAFVSANIDWSKNTSEDNKLIQDALEDYGSTSYIIVEREGIRVGIYGVMGEDADACAPESGLEFEDIVESSKEVVEELQAAGVDLIVCLSHSGTSEDADKSEDELLAKEVPDIDVIISGHTHTTLEEPIQSGDTYIVSAGSYCENLGELELTQKEDGRWEMENYTLNFLGEDVAADSDILEKLEAYKEIINTEYLQQFGYTFDQVLAENQVEFTQMADFAQSLEEDPLGSIIADSYVYTVQQAEGDGYEKVDVAVSPSGAIRDTFQKGELTVSDAFNVSSLGIGADRIPGYPLVSVYLTGEELKTAAEIDVSVSPLMTTAQLYPSGLRWEYNINRLILNRVTDVKLVTNVPHSEDGREEEIVDDKLYRVVAGLYSAQMLEAVEDTSKGILKVTPKDKDGNVIEDFEDYIIHDENGAELKEWYALATYLESFDKNEQGLSTVPAYYEKAEGRKESIDSKNPIDLLKHPNQIAFVIYGFVLILILLIIFVIRFVIKRRKKRKNVI